MVERKYIGANAVCTITLSGVKWAMGNFWVATNPRPIRDEQEIPGLLEAAW